MRILRPLLLLFLFVPELFAQNMATITGSNFSDNAGNSLKSGTIYFAPTDCSMHAISYQRGSGGQTFRTATSCTITNGAITGTCQLPNTALTTPKHVCFNTYVVDSSDGSIVLGSPDTPGSGYSAVQPSSGSEALSWCAVSSGVLACNLDSYAPNLSNLALTQAGPYGLNWLGTWTAEKTYGKRDAVAYSGSSYVSTIDNNTAAPGGTGWDILSSAGNSGTAATVSVGSTTTGAVGTSASVSNSGSPSAAVLNFVIPKGDKGDTGATGATGPQGAAGLGSDANCGADGSGNLSCKKVSAEIFEGNGSELSGVALRIGSGADLHSFDTTGYGAFVASSLNPTNSPNGNSFYSGIRVASGENPIYQKLFVTDGLDWYWQSQGGGSWGNWYRFLDSKNFMDYSPTLSGAGATGTWPISITGNANTSTTTEFTDLNYNTSGDWDADFKHTPVGRTSWNQEVSGGPTNGWWMVENMRHTNDQGYWGRQNAWGWSDNANEFYTRNISSGTWGSWVRFLNSSNFNSYAPSLTGTGATGTWNINVTGSASGFAPISFADMSITSYTGSEAIALIPIARTMTVPSGGVGTVGSKSCTSQYILAVAPTSSATFKLLDNGTEFGTVTFAASATTGTATISSAKTLSVGEVFAVVAPLVADTTAAGFSMALCASY